MTSKEFGKILQDKLTSEYGVEPVSYTHLDVYKRQAAVSETFPH